MGFDYRSEEVGKKAPEVIRKMAVGEETSESFGTFLAVVGKVRVLTLFDFLSAVIMMKCFLGLCAGHVEFYKHSKAWLIMSAGARVIDVLQSGEMRRNTDAPNNFGVSDECHTGNSQTFDGYGLLYRQNDKKSSISSRTV